MADPLLIPGLVIRVVSLGLQVCGSIKKYLDALDSRKEDIRSANQKTKSLRKTLRSKKLGLCCIAGY